MLTGGLSQFKDLGLGEWKKAHKLKHIVRCKPKPILNCSDFYDRMLKKKVENVK